MFQKGDIVGCIDSSSGAGTSIGKKYIVLEATPDGYIKIYNDSEYRIWTFAKNFILCKPKKVSNKLRDLTDHINECTDHGVQSGMIQAAQILGYKVKEKHITVFEVTEGN